MVEAFRCDVAMSRWCIIAQEQVRDVAMPHTRTIAQVRGRADAFAHQCGSVRSQERKCALARCRNRAIVH